ncbi:MAG: DUF167 domain-containing protein [Candidatus Wildermuthbacteria bacterium]|nr:DUF167 domain-containing protein [Candidatus Wildermuthbacteria bacterium]
MKIFVKAKPNAKEEKLEKIDEEHFIVSVKEPPVQGRANAAIIKVLALYFLISPSNIRIISGFTSKSKILDIQQ